MSKTYDINNFSELMDKLSWDWSLEYPLKKYEYYYAMNKTYIDKNSLSYKSEYYTLNPKVFTQLEMFYKLFIEE